MINRLFLLALALAATAACSESKELTGVRAISAMASSQVGTDAYRCDVYWTPSCPQQDPNPEEDGIFLNMSRDDCDSSITDQNDVDADGLTDICEQHLAQAFAPLLSTNVYDKDLSREPYWAVKPAPDTTAFGVTQNIRIMYMLGFHTDMGNDFSSACWTAIGCGGHLGDSEYVVVDVAFFPSANHWVVQVIHTSAHGAPSYALYSGVEFPSHNRAYPRVYVARDKHGTYKDIASCNSGATFHADDCTANQDDVRFEVVGNRNVGSSAQSLISDPVSSTYSTFQYGGYEYFWQDVPFCGWDTASSSTGHACFGDEEDPTQSYFEILMNWGY